MTVKHPLLREYLAEIHKLEKAFILQRGGESRRSDEAAAETMAVSQEATEAEPTGQQDA